MDLSRLAELLRQKISGRAESNVDLARFTTYRVGGPAALYVEPEGLEDIAHLGEALREAGLDGGRLPVLPLGRGSNLVISDGGFPGLVIRLANAFSWIEPHPDDSTGAKAGSATSMPQLANWAARRALSGFEWAISIPGSVGGGVRMNAGAHGGEVGDVLRSATICDLTTFAVTDVDVLDLDMSYRHTNLSDSQLVLEARFGFKGDEEAAVKARMEGYRKHRAETQPGALQNAGSVFKNPEGDSAGRLVEACGLKGYKVGGAEVSQLHANFFIAGDGSTAQDVFELVHQVKKRVRDETGVDLQPEIRFVGAFGAAEGELHP